MAGSLKRGLTSKRESAEGKKASRGGNSKRHEGGFAEGDYGRGPTPYAKSHSASPGTLAQHAATAGRGAAGIFGAGEQHKGHSADLGHPASHAEFEELGRK